MNQWEFLQKIVANRKISQAMIFAGPDDLGKRDMAVEFFKLLGNKDLIDQGKHPDLIILEPEGKGISIDQVRDLQKRLSMSVQVGEFKMAIIDKAHLMNVQAQNCLLKTLEEPRGDTIVILITSKVDSLLSTIRSRSQIIKFTPDSFVFKGEDKFTDVSRVLGMGMDKKVGLFQDMFGKEAMFEDVDGFLESMENYLRIAMLQGAGIKLDKSVDVPSAYSVEKIKDSLMQVSELRVLISNTNVNMRLAFENLMINI